MFFFLMVFGIIVYLNLLENVEMTFKCEKQKWKFLLFSALFFSSKEFKTG